MTSSTSTSYRFARTLVALATVVGFGVLTPPAVAEGPVSEGVPSFGESAGCGALDGVGGPRMGTTGFLPDSTPVYGPWGDFFGRTIGSVRSQLVKVHLPGQPKDLWIHERAFPAFEQVLDNLAVEAARGNTYPISEYTWSFNPATIPPTTKLSFHGVGASIDVNSHTNPYRADNVLITDMPQWFVDAWRDAGWCWGGDWQTIKDPMHYSWMGPIHTPGYDIASAPPQSPLVAYSNYSNSPSFPEFVYDVTFDTGSADGVPQFAVDLDANGAADIVRLREGEGGTIVLEVSRARHDYTRSIVWASTTSAPTNASAPVTLADVTGDARPDLVYFLEQPDGMLDLEVFPLVQGGALVATTVTTSVPVGTGDVYLLDDFDMDGEADLYVVRPGAPGSIEVWLGPAFASAAVDVAADLPADSQYATGDRDFDGTADLYALAADGGLRIFIGDPGTEAPSDPVRVAGNDRFETAAAASQLSHPGGADTVYIAVGTNFPDAIAAGPAAAVDDAPILLVQQGSIPQATRAELLRLDASEVVVLGGPVAISDAVVSGLEALLPAATVERRWGATRYETAVAVTQAVFGAGVDTLYIATGEGFPDAIVAAPAAMTGASPMLLTRSSVLPTAVRDEIERLGPSRIVIVGGSNAVSGAIETELRTLATKVERITGSDRYALSAAVSKASHPSGAATVYVAVGTRYPDALAAGPLTTTAGGPLLLVDTNSLPSSVATELARLDPHNVIVLGGDAAVSNGVVALIAGYQVSVPLPSFSSVGAIAASQVGLDPTGEALFVDDLDGDGHPDLLLVDADGNVRMRRGGFSTHVPGVWFVVDSEL